LTAALKSVKGVTVLTEPKQATGDQNRRAATVAIVEAPDTATLKAIKTAVEAANTPHKAQNAPTLLVAAEGKVDGESTLQAVRQAVQSGKLKRVEL
jgi:hypothetical protein